MSPFGAIFARTSSDCIALQIQRAGGNKQNMKPLGFRVSGFRSRVLRFRFFFWGLGFRV